MDNIGMPNVSDIAKVGEATTGFIGAVNRLLPGISLRSIQKANSKTTKLILSDLKRIAEWGAKLGLSDETIRELQFDAVKRHRRTVNLAGVLEYAENEIRDDADVSCVEDDWLESFHDHAEKVSNPGVQVIWGKLIAGEINNPGTYSKRLMSVISDMSTTDAQSFSTLCSLSIQSIVPQNENEGIKVAKQPLALLFEDDNSGTFDEGAFSYEQRIALEAYGLIDSSVRNRFNISPNKAAAFLAMNKVVLFKNNGDSPVELSFSPVFTEIGVELSSLCSGIGSSKSLETALIKTAEEEKLELVIQ